MIDTEINIAIAEWCGWKKYPHHPLAYTHPTENRTELVGNMPSYTTDLNAMWEAEERLFKEIDTMGVGYLRRLEQVVNSSMGSYWPQMHATARQRAEALLRTIGKWTE